MDISLNLTILNNIKLESPNDYLRVYVSHQLNYNKSFYKDKPNFHFIIDNFSWLYENNDNDFVFINNIIHILLQTLEMYDKNPYNIEDILDTLIIIFSNSDHHTLIFKLLFEVLHPLLNNLLLNLFHYFYKKNDHYNILLSKMNILLHTFGAIYVENYLYNKVTIYQSYSLNNLNLEKIVLKDYKCLLMMTYILLHYVNTNKIYYHQVYDIKEIIYISNNQPEINIYNKKHALIDTCMNNNDSNDCNDKDSNECNDKDITNIIVHKSFCNEISAILNKTYNNIMYKYSLYLCSFLLEPLHYKCIQLKEDIMIVNRTIEEVNNRYLYSNNNTLMVETFQERKETLQQVHNHFYSLIYNDYLYSQITNMYNQMFKSCLYNNINIKLKVVENSITFIYLFYINKIHLENIDNMEYILVSFLYLLNNKNSNNKIHINIYNKCLIVNIFALNKNTVINYILSNKHEYIPILLDSIVDVYKKIEMNTTYDKEEKYLLRYNIHMIINELVTNNNIIHVSDICTDVCITDLFFLLIQDINYFFEYIISYIKYRSTLISNNRLTFVTKYCLYFKESILLLEKMLHYNKNIICNQSIDHLIVYTFNTYLDKILNDPIHYIYFNFNNINIYFSWKIDLLEKINSIYGIYKNNNHFCSLFLSENSNYNTKTLKQIELFIDDIQENIHDNIIKTDLDILMDTIQKLDNISKKKVDIYNPILDVHKNIPSIFLDPILMSFIKQPILLPDSNIIVDTNMIYNHLLLHNSDPFCNTYLTKQILTEFNSLSENIEKINTFTQDYNAYMDMIREKIDDNGDNNSNTNNTSDSGGNGD